MVYHWKLKGKKSKDPRKTLLIFHFNQKKKKKTGKSSCLLEIEDAEASVRPDAPVVGHYAKRTPNFSIWPVLCGCTESTSRSESVSIMIKKHSLVIDKLLRVRPVKLIFLSLSHLMQFIIPSNPFRQIPVRNSTVLTTQNVCLTFLLSEKLSLLMKWWIENK